MSEYQIGCHSLCQCGCDDRVGCDMVGCTCVGTCAFTPSLAVPVGTHSMVDYVSTTGTYNGTAYTGVFNVYDDVSDDGSSTTHEMAWTCEADDTPEEVEVSLPVTQFAELLGKANAWDKAVREGHVHVHSIAECATCGPSHG